MTEPVFFAPSRQFSVGEIAAMTGGEVVDSGFASTMISSLGSAEAGGRDSLVFVDGPRNAGLMKGLRAAAVLCQSDLARLAPDGVAVIACDAPHLAFARMAKAFHPGAARPGPMTAERGISPAATIAADAAIEAGAVVEAGAVIGSGAEIGAGTIVAPNAVVGPSCRIGRDCYVGPNAVVQCALIGNRVIIHSGAKIGQDGFGFVPGASGFEKIPQIGRVIVQDDVEIGANTTVDRGAISDTVIGDGTKIDNLVQIGHNVRIGRCCAIAGQCGISGSVTIGDFVMVGGGAGIRDHLSIGTGARLAAGGGYTHDVPPGARWGGFPAQPIKTWLREVSVLREIVSETRKKRAK